MSEVVAAAPVRLAPADFGTRFSAFMIDTAILFVAQWVMFIALSRSLQAAGLTSLDACSHNVELVCEGPSTILWVILLVFLLISTVAYTAVFEGLYGATPAKRLMGLHVVNMDGTTPIGLGPAIVRSVVRQAFWLMLFLLLDASPLAIPMPSLIFLALPAVAIAGVAVGAVAGDGRAVHDLAAGTMVVRTDGRGRQITSSSSNI